MIDYRTQRNDDEYLKYLECANSNEQAHDLDESSSSGNYDEVASAKLVCDCVPQGTSAQGAQIPTDVSAKVDDDCDLFSANSNEDDEMSQENKTNSQIDSGTICMLSSKS